MAHDISELEYSFFTESYSSIKEIKSTEKVWIELVYYKPASISCILKIYKKRNLEEIYRKLKNLHHPGLTAIYDVMVYHGDTYILEEMISGKTLDEYLTQEGSMSEQELIPVMCSLCDGLIFLHSQNPPLIHRDIKPSNVMLREDGSVKLIDFDALRIYREDNVGGEDTIHLGRNDVCGRKRRFISSGTQLSDSWNLRNRQ